jgi:two-component system nitrate/nitrite response regulator NarL
VTDKDTRAALADAGPPALAPTGLAPTGLAPTGLAPTGLAPTGLAPTGPRVSALRVAILASDEVLRWGLDAMAGGLPAVESARRCGSPEELRELLPTGRFDVLIVAEADASGLANLLPQLRAAGTRILLLIDDRAEADPPGYDRDTVDGLVSRGNLSAAALGEALGCCAAGLMPMPVGFGRALLARAGQPTPAPPGRLARPVLTSRESETLRLIADGLSNAQIARQLGISSHGAKRLVASIMIKLGSPNRTTAVVHAIKAGLIDCVDDDLMPSRGTRGELTVINTPHRRVTA